MTKLKLHWWVGEGPPNLGDELGSIIFERVYGTGFEHSSIFEADLVTVGSVLQTVVTSKRIADREKPLHVVGSGLMWQMALERIPDSVRIHSVRGILSKNALERTESALVPIGDPGLLVPRLTDAVPTGSAKMAVIPHRNKVLHQGLRRHFDTIGVEILDIRTKDLDTFCQKMCEYEFILSESLHGLIIADAFGIPNAWLRLNEIHKGGSYKFYDYFGSVGRDPAACVEGLPGSILDVIPHVQEPRASIIRRLQQDILEAFESAKDEIGSSF